MGLRFRKSLKIAPGLRINISKRGLGASIGGKGFTHSIGPSGRRTSVGLPGTGIGISHQHGKASAPASERSSAGNAVALIFVMLIAAAAIYWIAG